MSQPPSGSGPYGPQGQNPYGGSPTPPPGYGAQPPAQNPYGQQPGQSPYGQPPAQTPYGQPTPPQNPYGQPAPQQPAYPSTPAPATPSYGTSPTPPPASPVYPSAPQSSPGFAATPPSYGGSAPTSTPAYGAPASTPSYGGAQSFGSPTPPAPSTPSYGGPASPQPYVPGQSAQGGWQGNGPATPQAYAPAGGLPPAPGKKSKTGLIIGVVAAVLVLLVGGGYLVSKALNKDTPIAITTPSVNSSASKAATSAAKSSSKSTASSSASGYPGFSQSGTALTGDGFTAVLPKGWTVSSSNGGKNEGEIVDAYNNVIDYYSDFSRNAAANCSYQTGLIASTSGVESADPVVKVDGITWGGSPAIGAKVTFKRASQTKKEVVGFYCVDYSGISYMVRSIAWVDDDASVLEGTKSLLGSWKWS